MELVGEEPARGQARHGDCGPVQLGDGLELLACGARGWIGNVVVIRPAGWGPQKRADEARERERAGMSECHPLPLPTSPGHSQAHQCRVGLPQHCLYFLPGPAGARIIAPNLRDSTAVGSFPLPRRSACIRWRGSK